jgi:endonuclease/exonuclease/phosphatase family metal-dependent hydrolase
MTLCLSLGLVVSCYFSSSAIQVDRNLTELRVAAWNIGTARTLESDSGWPHARDPQAVAAILLASPPEMAGSPRRFDVLALSEVPDGLYMAALSNAVADGESVWTCLGEIPIVNQETVDSDSHRAILSRFPIVDCIEHALESVENKTSSTSVLEARVQFNGRTISVMSVHFPGDVEHDQPCFFTSLGEIIDARRPALIMGDFNTPVEHFGEPGHPAVLQLGGRGFRPTLFALPKKNWRSTSVAQQEVIDYVLYDDRTDISVLNNGVLTSGISHGGGDTDLSEHYVAWSVLGLPGATRAAR